MIFGSFENMLQKLCEFIRYSTLWRVKMKNEFCSNTLDRYVLIIVSSPRSAEHITRQFRFPSISSYNQ